jgi:putative hydrolase of the HAD superfamily
VALGRVEAVLLDSFGTLVSMEPPGPRLRAALARVGVEVSEERAAAAFRAEIGYYLEHHVEGRDAESLSELRDRCARVLLEALGVTGLSLAAAREAMLDAIRFAAWPDAAPALSELRAAGLRLVVASNWDASLPDVLAQAGLLDLVDGAVPSAAVGAAKPAPALFEAAIGLAGCDASRALYVGDSPRNDVAGAHAAGIRAVLLERGGERIDAVAGDEGGEAAPDARIGSLAELPRVLSV